MKNGMQRESFRAMGTMCAVAATATPPETQLAAGALAAARREVSACERALSRFDQSSDLSRLNRAAGAWVTVDTRLVQALAAALRARTDTGGLFDPTVLPALVAAGYDRSFALLTNRASGPVDGWHPNAAVELDPDSRRVRIEAGAAVDLGGIGKGFTATRALEAMRAARPSLQGALVDLGGDLAFWGSPPEGGPWLVDIADPRSPGRVDWTLELTGGGIATSGRDTRRFGPGRQLHHLIDPATGRPAAAGPLAVTVVAPSATEADAYATGLAVTDLASAEVQLARRPDFAAWLIPNRGEPIAIGRIPLAPTLPQRRLVITTTLGR